MVKTVVELRSITGQQFVYLFSEPKEKFLEEWNRQLKELGFFSGEEADGNTVFLYPKNSLAVTIRSKQQR